MVDRIVCDANDSLQASVEEHVGGPDAEIESTLKQFQEAIAYVLVHCAFKMSVLIIQRARCPSKYRYMELNLQQRKKGLLEKIPDIQKTLSMVSFLRDRRVNPTFSPGQLFPFLRLMVLISWENQEPKATAMKTILKMKKNRGEDRLPLPSNSTIPSMRKLNWKIQMWYISG
jgi:hypothetical protein